MNPEEVIVFVVLAGLATGIGILAQRQANKLGMPAAAVPVVGALVVAIIGNN